MRLNILDSCIFSENDTVLLVWILWIWLCIVDVDQRRRNQGARHVVDGIHNTHRTVLPLDTSDEIEVHVETQ